MAPATAGPALREACRHQHRQALRQRTGRRGHGEEGYADQEDAPRPEDLAQRAAGQKRHQHGELVARDHPHCVGGMGPERGGNGGQRDIGDGAVKHDKHERQEQHRDSKVAARCRQAVIGAIEGGALGHGGSLRRVCVLRDIPAERFAPDATQETYRCV
tara:strand:+ start:7056 stop:7532 length:477 start_codon:yes stop_codon:yes gene_type:complete